MEKVEQSFVLAAQIRAVDVGDAATILLNGHFLLDMMGNLRAYATQSFRCKSCNTSYRRPPLSGRCSQAVGRNGRCEGALGPTVFEASVRKYLVLSQGLASTPGVTPYVRQRIQVLADSLATLFPGNSAQTTLETYQAA
jgi:DNA polymerase II large subunit